jgi:hypothetical protein
MNLYIKQQFSFVNLVTNCYYCNDEKYYKFGKRILGWDKLGRGARDVENSIVN